MPRTASRRPWAAGKGPGPGLAPPARVDLPLPGTEPVSYTHLTCELWVRPDGDAASGAILSLGASTLSLNGGRLHLESGNAETPASVEASGQPFAAGTWHHVAVALGTENVSLYVDCLLYTSRCV